ncbi:MAG: hypothetical protein KGN36_14410, partial [Acidobacteriota bacterium]|nr:hypothetical protein [Acidobacteriota bacterium]
MAMFQETQALRQQHVRVILAFPPAALWFITLRQIVWHKPWGSPPVSNGGLVFLSLLLLAVYLRLITVRMVTEVRAGEIFVGLRGLWKTRRIRMTEIRKVEVVTYDPAGDFGGYGIRSGRGGTAYIASGNRGVELGLEGGGKVLIGSQDA